MPEIQNRPYDRVQAFLAQLGGTMTYAPGGGPGGTWFLQLHGRSIQVPVRDRSVNDLDRLYEPNHEPPATWDDYAPDAPLRADAFWQLVSLFR